MNKTQLNKEIIFLWKAILIRISIFIVIAWWWILTYALSEPNFTPNWQAVWWRLSILFNWILQSWDYNNPLTDSVYKVRHTVNSDNINKLIWNNHMCPAWEILQWFDNNWNKICTSVWPTICKTWYDKWYTTDWVYLIDPDWMGPIAWESLYCNMSWWKRALVAGIKSNWETDSDIDYWDISGELTNYSHPSGKVSDDFINTLFAAGKKEMAVENLTWWKIQITSVPEWFTSWQAYYYNNCTFTADTNKYRQGNYCTPCHRSAGSYSLCYYPSNGWTLQNTTANSPSRNIGRLWVR